MTPIPQFSKSEPSLFDPHLHMVMVGPLSCQRCSLRRLPLTAPTIYKSQHQRQLAFQIQFYCASVDLIFEYLSQLSYIKSPYLEQLIQPLF